MAPTPLLATKLFVPRSPRRLVPRPRLRALLDRGSAASLLLVSAPAGFGKTTLLAEWLAGEPRTVAWLSLDAADSQPTTFWTYVVAALQTVAPGVGEVALALLQASRPAPITAVLSTLLNDLAARPGELVLVLDDYHVVDAPEVHEAMSFLLDHLPPGVHVVLAGRADPALPLARLRARGELVEVRAAELRFTPAEALAYLNGEMGLQLTAGDVAALEARTEGWIAALQLAALSLQGRDDAAGFIAGFAGDARYVVDYLVEEVLHRQPAAVQQFLLETSVLDRLSGPLCDAVTGSTGGRDVLDTLDRGNLFLVPLDGQRRWYRYHHLFAEMLRARLRDGSTDVPALHRRASDWYAAHGEPDAAIEHALAGGDLERAADLIELAAPAAGRDRREATLRRWFAALPDELFRARPVLAIGQVGALMSTGDVSGVEVRLRDVQRWLDEGAGTGLSPAGMVVRDEAELGRLPSRVAIYRAGLALLGGDPAGTAGHAREALALLAQDDHLGRGAAGALIGLASWGSGDLASAEAGYAQSMASLQRAGHVSDVLGCAVTLADLQVAQGRLGDAEQTYERALRLAAEQGGPPLRGTPDMHVGLAALHLERGDLDAARDRLRRSHTLGEHLGLPQNPHRWRLATARLREAEGDLAAADDLLDEAERVYQGDFSPDVRPVAAVRARLWLVQRRLPDALRWARERDLSAGDDLSYLREFEHVTLARVLLAQERGAGPAFELLARLLPEAQLGGRTGTVIEVLVLQALTQQALHGAAPALVPLEQALTLAEPEGYARVFVGEGPAMAALLAAAARRGVTPGYAGRLLGRLDRSPAHRPSGLVDPLSEREVDVLRLLATDLGGPEIARALVVSLHTVRTHTKNIYAKLGVHDRRAAVSRARELQLLTVHDRP